MSDSERVIYALRHDFPRMGEILRETALPSIVTA